MRTPVTSFNGWILGKINGYLERREGCSVHKTEYTDDGARTVVQDSLGFVYEVSIKTIGRVQKSDGGGIYDIVWSFGEGEIMNNVKNIIMDLGHLQIYNKTTLQHPMGDGALYYTDKRFPVEVGPFYSNSDALNHWKSVTEGIHKTYQKEGLAFVEPEIVNNVIYVDFQAKRRRE